MNREDENMVPISEIEINKPLIKTIKYKPTYPIYVCIVFGILLIATRHIAGILVGAFFIILGSVVLFVVKEKDTVSIYEDSIIVYDYDRADYGRKIMFDEIVEWSCKSKDGNSSGVTFTLNNDQVVYKDTFQTSVLYKELNKLIPTKEAEARRIEANKGKKLVFDNPFKRFGKGKKD